MNEKMNTVFGEARRVVAYQYPANKQFFIALYGSQNYGLETPQSDCDLIAIILPTKSQVLLGAQPISEQIKFNYGEITIKDIRLYLRECIKGGPTILETLYTDYLWVNPNFADYHAELTSNREAFSMNPVYTLDAFKGIFIRYKNKAVQYHDKDLTLLRKATTNCARVFYMLDSYTKNWSFVEALQGIKAVAGDVLYFKTKASSSECIDQLNTISHSFSNIYEKARKDCGEYSTERYKEHIKYVVNDFIIRLLSDYLEIYSSEGI